MAKNEILQVVVFSLFAGIAISAVGEKAKALLHIIEQGATVILKITTYVMMFAPFAIFAAIAGTISTQGIGILVTYAKLVGDFYISISILVALMIFVAWLVVGRQMGPLLKAIRSPALIAFSTSTSEAAFPLLLESLEAMGFSSKIVSFVLPLGYSFNLVGSTMYCTFAAMFIAQAYNIHVPHRPAGADAADADDDVQRHRGRAARLVGGGGRDPALFQPAGAGPVPDPGGGSSDGHGPQRHQCDRQWPGFGRGGEMGECPADARGRAAGSDCLSPDKNTRRRLAPSPGAISCRARRSPPWRRALRPNWRRPRKRKNWRRTIRGYYPPTRLNMRGSHPGSFEAAHELRDGDFWNGATALHDTGEEFDLIVVGGGISGLSAAYFYRQAKPNAKILILDNHDDFGGHAKRNEFHVARPHATC